MRPQRRVCLCVCVRARSFVVCWYVLPIFYIVLLVRTSDISSVCCNDEVAQHCETASVYAQ